MATVRALAGRFYRATVPIGLRRVLARRAFGTYSIRPFDRHHCIFVHLPKTGGISVSTSLFGNLAGGHRSLADYREIFGDDLLAAYFKFAFVRNPWDRLLSAYRFLLAGGKTREDRRWAQVHLTAYSCFEDFVMRGLHRPEVLDWIHFRPQWRFVTLPGQAAPTLDFIGRFERLGTDFAAVADRLGIEATLRHLNRSSDSGFAAAYTPAAVARVGEIYARDIELFGYAPHA